MDRRRSIVRQEDQKKKIRRIILLLLSFLQCLVVNAVRHNNTVESLLLLKKSFTNSTALSTWTPSRRPCFGPVNHWVGLICSKGGSVYGLRLENMGLSGKIDMEALRQLPRLRTINLRGNHFGGSLPEIKKLKPLKALYLSNNGFEGRIKDRAFEGMNWLKKLHLGNNKFSGKIPSSLTELPKLVDLLLQGNRFDGGIPDFNNTSFHNLSLANNRLEGRIPVSLSHISPQAFSGNKGLCGKPLEPCHPTPWDPQAPPPTPKHQTTSNSSIIIPIIITIAILLLIALSIIAYILKKRNSKTVQSPQHWASTSDMENGHGDDIQNTTTTPRARGKDPADIIGSSSRLCFLREVNDKFDLPDLLKASAEILGSGCFGASYKASLINGPSMVVKRFKQMTNVSKEDFHEHLIKLGKLNHTNLLPILAYYYRKEEKLLVSEFVQNGSLAIHLHGRGQPMLDWSTRLKIIKGVAKGLHYLYKQLPIMNTPHGHLKSSNVLLDQTFNPLLNDHGLIPLINKPAAKSLMAAYKSPEFIHSGQINRKTDVWCLGILIVETLTGEFPAQYLQQGSGVDLNTWVKTAVDQHKGNQVFDKNMTAAAAVGSSLNSSEGEMRKMLEIGLACCENQLDNRLSIDEACQRIDGVKERDHDDDYYTSYTADDEHGDRRSTRGLSDEFDVIDS